MRVIPVLDLKHGLVVRARAGDRASYAPIETPLAAIADPFDVAAGLLRVTTGDALYIADLDAIEGRAGNLEVVAALAARWPAAEIWLDDGTHETAALLERMAVPGLRPVIGSECQTSPALVEAANGRAVLSLDWRGEHFLGPPALLDPAVWPRDVVVMTLARVGTGEGPDFDRLDAVLARAGPARRVFAAGGVRSSADLAALAKHGIAGALVATALHSGAVTSDDIGRLARPA